MEVNTESFTIYSRALTTQMEAALEDIVEKGMSAGKQHFPLFSTKFTTYFRINSII